MLRFLPFIVLFCLCAALGYGLYKQTHGTKPPTSAMVGKKLPKFSGKIYGENAQYVAPAANTWRLLNVFGSWCMSCLIEHPEWMRLSEGDYTLTLIGLNWRDTEPQLEPWLKRHGNPYDVIIMDPEGKAVVELGVSGAPESFLIDPSNTIRFHYSGPLTAQLLEQEVLPFLTP